MNGNDFFSRVERRHSQHSTQSDAQRIDDLSGLSFKKRAKTRHSSDSKRVFASPESPGRHLQPLTNQFDVERANDLYDTQILSQPISPSSPGTDATSVKTATTIQTTQRRVFRDLPPKDAKIHEYYRYIPTNLKKDTRLKQLIIWSMQNELKEDQYLIQSRDPMTEIIKQKLLEKTMFTSSLDNLVNPITRGVVESANKLVNEKCRERTLKIENDIKDLKIELQDWNNSIDKVLEFHADTTDKIDQLKAKEYNVEKEDFINEIDSDQRKFITEFLKDEPEYKISDVISDMNLDVTQLRQTLNTVNQFCIESDQILKKYKSELAKKLRENTRILPLTNKQEELDNLHKLLKIFSRQSSTVSNMEIDSVPSNDNNNNNNMDIDE